VPACVTTRTSTVPVPAGDVTWIFVGVWLMMLAAADPKLTAVTFLNPVPVMVTLCWPASGPESGETPVMDGVLGDPW
jgi:hypothetical protein